MKLLGRKRMVRLLVTFGEIRIPGDQRTGEIEEEVQLRVAPGTIA